MAKPDNPFDWSGGHPALDFVNTLDERPSDEPVETLVTYDALVWFAELAGLVDPAAGQDLRRLSGPVCSRVVTRARGLREHLQDVLAAAHRQQAVPADELEAMTDAIRQAHAARVLTASGRSGLARYRWKAPAAADLPLHACALAIEDLLVRVDRSLIRKCGAHDCDVYFVDTSKGHRRQWCSMQNCGNREKQRRTRQRARGGERGTPAS